MKKEKEINWVLKVLLAFSFSILAFYQIVITEYTQFNVTITIFVAFICGFWLVDKSIHDNFKYIREHLATSCLILFVAVIITIKLYDIKGVRVQEIVADTWVKNLFSIYWSLFSAIALFYSGVWLFRKGKNLLREIADELEPWDKKIYIFLSVLSLGVLALMYTTNCGWYIQNDNVYSIDSGYCYSSIFPDPAYYDVRHPLISLITFPLWAVLSFISDVLIPENLRLVFCAVGIQSVNVQLLLGIGLLLKIMTKNKRVFLLYMFSFPTLLFSVFLEKYQMCTFLLVLYVYIVWSKPENSKGNFILAAGTMPTSGFIGVLELIVKTEKKEKLIKIIKLIVQGILMLICLGRGHMLFKGLEEITTMRQSFSAGALSTGEKIISVMKMIQSAFIPLSSNVTEKYIWSSVTSQLSVISIIIMLVILIGIISNWKKFLSKVFAIWILFSFILFVVLNWSSYESPLFSIYFSWAIVPAFVMGLDYLIEKFRLNSKVIYNVLLALILVINLMALVDISNFLHTI